MKRTAYLGSPLLLFFLLLVPTQSWAQADVDAYTAFYAEENATQKLAMGEKFLQEFKTSQYLEPVFLTIVPMHAKASNWAKVMEYTEKLEQLVPNMKPGNKAAMYSQGMAAAQQSNNDAKVIAFGEKVIAIAPGDVPTLVTVASTIPRALPADASAKTAALDKALKYGNSALSGLGSLTAKDFGLPDSAWATQKTAIEGAIHGALGETLYHKADYEKAATELTAATKAMPKDPNAWFFLGLSLDQQSLTFAKSYQAAAEAQNEAIKKRAERFQIEELTAQAEALRDTVRSKRGEVIEALASAVANGAQQAMPRLEALYKLQNNDSLTGLDKLIASKK
jgi:tetratricopeptide (TPR) repeat protein